MEVMMTHYDTPLIVPPVERIVLIERKINNSQPDSSNTATNYQLPTTNYQLPTANCQLPTANCQLPTANCKHTTINNRTKNHKQ
jgi:hypothetical protein